MVTICYNVCKWPDKRGESMICAFTGHRPEKLPWGTREDDPRCAALKQQIALAVERAAEAGADVFACGMARGCDFYFAEAVLSAKRKWPGMELEAWLPCEGQSARWPDADRTRYKGLLSQCDRVILVERPYSNGCMLRRNMAMLDRADRLISVYSGGGGGTGQAVAYARSRGLFIDALWL